MLKAYQLMVLAIALAAMLSGCRNRDGSLSRRTQEYEVVTEGSVNGVTSTLSAPGESPVPLVSSQPPLTDTNADTTTAFQILDSTVTTGTEQPGSLADTLPQTPPPRVYRPAPRPSPEPVTPPVESPTRSDPEPQPEPEEREPEPEEREPEPEPEPEPQQPAQDAGDEEESTTDPE